MKKKLLSVLLFGMTLACAQSAHAFRPSGWMYHNYPWAYEAGSGDWYWFSTADTQWVHGYPPASGWRRLNQSALAHGWVYYQWPYAYAQSNQAWHWISEPSTQWVVNMRQGAWSRLGVGSGLSSGIWRAQQANVYSLSVTVDASGAISSAFLKVYYNDGWLSSDSRTFSASRITTSGSSFAAKISEQNHSYGSSLHYFEIIGTFQANGTITGTYKASYYHDPPGMRARTNTKQGSFTAHR